MPAVLSQWRQHRAYRREAQAQPLQVPESSLEELLVKGRFGYTRIEDRKARKKGFPGRDLQVEAQCRVGALRALSQIACT